MAGIKGKSGRKPKAEDIAMIEKLTPLDEMAFIKLKEGIEAGDFKFIRLYFLYRWGSPRQMQDVTITSEVPIFNIKDVFRFESDKE